MLPTIHSFTCPFWSILSSSRFCTCLVSKYSPHFSTSRWSFLSRIRHRSPGLNPLSDPFNLLQIFPSDYIFYFVEGLHYLLEPVKSARETSIGIIPLCGFPFEFLYQLNRRSFHSDHLWSGGESYPKASVSSKDDWLISCSHAIHESFNTYNISVYPKPALGGARPEAFGICEAHILTYAYVVTSYFQFPIWNEG